MNGGDSILSFEKVSKRFGKKRVLDEASFELRAGDVTVLLGANGAGKSTLLRLAHGLLKPEGGRIAVCGLDPIRDGRKVRRSIGYVPDRPDAPPWMSARELFRFLAPQYPSWDAGAAGRMSERLRVPLDTPFRALSLGEATKAMLVAAMAHAPRLLLLDEPFSGLDAAAREELLRGFLSEVSLDGRTVLVTTHDLDVASRIADRIAVLANGRIERDGPIDEVTGGEASAGKQPAKLRLLIDPSQRKWIV
jgi:ABC-2 type transport system ATP-binding protein